MFDNLFLGLSEVLHWGPLLSLVIGVALGMVIGALPGLSTTVGVALAIPVTFSFDPLTALALMAGMHVGGSQGGAIPAILLRIPGSSGAIVTCWDGHAMSEKGHARGAIQLSAFASAFGGAVAALVLLLGAPPLARIGLMFGPPEVFWVTVFGFATVISLVGADILKGLASICLGLFIGMVGIDPISGALRYDFGVFELSAGISEPVVMIGLFSIPPAVALINRTSFFGTGGLSFGPADRGRGWTIAGVWRALISSTFIGILFGIVPGSGGSSFVAYAEAKRASKAPELFGKGSPEGLAAAEAVNNADNAGAMIPALALGIPGGAVAAIVLGALVVHGIQPGPSLFTDHPDIVFGYGWLMLFGALLLLPMGGVAASRIFVQALRVPPVMLMTFIAALVVIGALANKNSFFDVYLVLAFGIIALITDKVGLPVVPMVIALVLGPMTEYNLRVSLLLSHGDPLILVTRPISIVLLALTLLVVIFALRARRQDAALAVDGPR